MYALITGASSGIGYELAKLFSKNGFDLVLVARREDKLLELKESLTTNVIIKAMDISLEENIDLLIDSVKELDIRYFINNAGFGDAGPFTETDINKEMNMINLNVKALYLLTKKALTIMNKGRILNVASVAGILPAGPYMAQYYATKSYVRSLSLAIDYELKKAKSKVRVSVLCPGPVRTEFDKVANVKLSLKGMKASRCAKIAYKKLLRGKRVIIPGFLIKCSMIVSKLIPNKMAISIVAHQQKKKV